MGLGLHVRTGVESDAGDDDVHVYPFQLLHACIKYVMPGQLPAVMHHLCRN